MDHLKIRSVGGDETSAIRASGESDEHIEVQTAQPGGIDSLLRADSGQKSPRLQPVVFRWREDGVVSLEFQQEIPFSPGGYPAP
jgi:hypothetical protein